MANRKRRPEPSDDIFATPLVDTYIFRASDVTQYTGVPKWRLEKFLTGKQYRLSPSGHVGEGKGSWRLFSHEDLYRLAGAYRMVEDGFTAKTVSKVLEDIDDRDLLDTNNERFENTVTDVGLVRSKDGPRVVFAGSFARERPYYILPLRQLVREVDRRIAESRKEKSE